MVNQGVYEAGVNAEFLQIKTRKRSSEWGNVKPSMGIKTGVNWTFSKATDESFNTNESMGLNYINVPLLLEFCLGYKLGVTAPSRTPDTYEGRSNYDGSVINITHTPGTYNPGGVATQRATFFYTGPTFGYLFKSFNYSGDPINNVNLVKNNICWNVGLVFWLGKISFDFSYQKGLTSIYSGKNIPTYAYLMKMDMCLTKRYYQ